MTATVTDSRVDKIQFKLLAKYWVTDKAKEQSKRNTVCRSYLDEPHCMGTQSFDRVIEKMTQKAHGNEPSRDELYIHTRTRHNGDIVNDKAAEVVDCMRRGLDEMNDEGASWKDDVYAKVKGPEKKGRVRCIGTITKSWKSAASSSQSQQNKEIQDLKDEVKDLRGAVDTLLTVVQKQFSEENVEMFDAMRHLVNKQVPADASSAQVSPRGQSSNSCHQPDRI